MAVAISSIFPSIGYGESPDPELAQAAPAGAPSPPASGVADSPGPTAAPSQASQTLPTIDVTTKKLDDARNQILPETGSSAYHFNLSDIDALPLGDSTPLNQLLLQAPGVVQDSYGQLHVRGDHANLQYRIDGVIIPEPITGFGQSFDPRFASQVNLLTGALPAEYGYRTAGIIDIQTKGSAFQNSGSVSVTAGTNGYAEGALEYAGSSGDWNYFVSSSYLRSDLGIENPTSSRNALHDTTEQTHDFVFLSKTLDSNSRINLVVGTALNHFEIPDVPGQTPAYSLAGAGEVNSADLNARQDETISYEVLSYQASPNDRLDYQVALFHRYTDVHYEPDPIGDLVFLGNAATILRKTESTGLQGDFSYRLNDANTVRAGYFLEHERFGANDSSQVFPTDAAGNQTSNEPITIADSTHLEGGTYGLYVQDEWQPTPALTVNYGARFDKTDTVTDAQQLSPRLGLVYDLSNTTRLHAGYARYFTPPPTEIIGTPSIEKFVDTTGAVPTNVNTAVKAERSNYFDLGVSQELSPQLTVGLDAYYRTVRDLQDEGQFGNALIYSAFNYARGKVDGLEATGTYKNGNWTAYTNFAVSHAVGEDIETGQYNFSAAELAYIANNYVHLDHDQKYTASAGLSYRWGSTTLGGDALFGSGLRSGFANTDHLPAYTTVNLDALEHCNSQTLGKFEVRLALINLFDKVYEIRDGTGIGVGAPQWGARRGVFIGLTKPL
jgi:outer membrane receptor protein involved in Fe transport